MMLEFLKKIIRQQKLQCFKIREANLEIHIICENNFSFIFNVLRIIGVNNHLFRMGIAGTQLSVSLVPFPFVIMFNAVHRRYS